MAKEREDDIRRAIVGSVRDVAFWITLALLVLVVVGYALSEIR